MAVVRQGNIAYCIDKKGNKIAGTEVLLASAYFVESGYNDDGNIRYTVYSPGKYVVINNHSKFGFEEVKFTPYDTISLQDAALLMRTSKFLGQETKSNDKI